MARLKIYTIRGNYVMLRIPFGGTDAVAEFKGGDMNRNKYAELSTSNEVLQKAIETSNLFNRQIRLKYTGPELDEPETNKDVEEVTTFVQGQKYLKEKHGVNISEIRDGESFKAKCAELGLSFPNLKLK